MSGAGARGGAGAARALWGVERGVLTPYVGVNAPSADASTLQPARFEAAVQR